ncbi:MAG: hypothetical protein ABIH76_04670 [Candidatus Bathyarchaeota archaeon]
MSKKHKEKETASLAKTGNKKGALVPSYLQNGASMGLENIECTDIILPRIKLMQALSPEVSNGKAKPGDMINSLTGHNYGQSLEFVPLLHFKSRMFWQDRDEGNAVLCSSDDAKKPKDPNAPLKIAKSLKITGFPKAINTCNECPFGKFDGDEEDDRKKRPKCTLYYNFPILIKGDEAPSALAMSRTKLKVGKKLISLAIYTGESIAMFGKRYKISTVVEKKDTYSFFNYFIEPIGFVSEAEYQTTMGFYRSFKTMNVSVDAEHPEKEQ